MDRIHGIGASGGIAIGAFHLYGKAEHKIEKKTVSDTEKELNRLNAAREKAVSALNKIYLKSMQSIGEEDSMIFQIHIMMIQDEEFFGAIQDLIRNEKVCAEYAVWFIGQQFAQRFASMDDEYMQGRKTDVIDISKRLIQCLNGSELEETEETQVIIGAIDLMPSETIQMDKSKVLAFVTQDGSRTAHSAILARTLGIPSVVGIGNDFGKLQENMTLIVDGTIGELILQPDEKTIAEYTKRKQEYEQHRIELKALIGKSAVTKDGKSIEINANIGHASDVENAIQNGADGIGLFRSEFLYMEDTDFPSEEKQFESYKTVLEKMGGKRVIVRTLDLGADKQVPYMNIPNEMNPALGYRAIRFSLDKQDVFYTQLRALYRASVFGKLAIMFPMIISPQEVQTARKIAENVKKELTEKNIEFDNSVPLGIMIETPAAAVLSKELSGVADFFSIGTNDLTQYTLAVDRTNASVADLYDQRNPAVLKLMEITVKNAKTAGIPVGICGESAADTSLTETFIKMGVDELSVAPSSVLEIKQKVCSL